MAETKLDADRPDAAIHLSLLLWPVLFLRAGGGGVMTAEGRGGREPLSLPVFDLSRVMDVSSRWVIVTGGSNGIGSGICRACA